MEEVEIHLNREHTDYEELNREISQYLKSLESIEFEESVIAPPAGSLMPMDAETISYVVSIAANVAQFVAAIILIYQQVHAASPDQEATSKPPKDAIWIKARDIEISIPATKKGVDTFLGNLEHDDDEDD